MARASLNEAAKQFLRDARERELLLAAAKVLKAAGAGKKGREYKIKGVSKADRRVAYLAIEATRHASRAAETPPENNLRQSVYVIGSAGQPIKIGIATRPEARLKVLQTGFPHKLRIYAQFPAHGVLAYRAEQECHRRLAAFRLNGEWFDYDPYNAADLVKLVLAELTA